MIISEQNVKIRKIALTEMLKELWKKVYDLKYRASRLEDPDIKSMYNEEIQRLSKKIEFLEKEYFGMN